MHLKNKVLLLHHQNMIELWCNGNTTVSGSVVLGSNPGSSTEKARKFPRFFHFYPADTSVSQIETKHNISHGYRQIRPNDNVDFHYTPPPARSVSKLGAYILFDFCFPSCLIPENAVRLYCTGDMKNSSGIVQGAGYTRKSDASGKSVRI